jgi:hypothetical protein
MKPPIFVWKSGILDVFDTVAELQNRHPAASLLGADLALYDSSGQMLRVCSEPDGSARIEREDHQWPNPDQLAELLREYLERGGLSAEISHRRTLSELIELVYPSSKSAISASEGYQLSQPPPQLSDSEKGYGRLVDAFGLAVIVGIVAAVIGIFIALAYYSKLPSTPGDEMGDLGIIISGCCQTGVTGSLIGGLGVFFWAIHRFNVSGSLTGKSIAYACISLVVILVFIGVSVGAAFLIVTLLAG